jgi:hypothetical protein
MPAYVRPIALALTIAALTLTPDVAAQGADVDAATDEQKQAAQATFVDARAAFDERRFVDAMNGFRASWQIVASPNTHLMIAHSLHELGRFAEAYEELGLVAQEAAAAATTNPKYQDSVERALGEQQRMRASIALLTLDIPPASDDARLTIGGRVIPRAQWSAPIAVDPGNVSVVLQSAGQSVVRDIQLEAGSEQRLSLAPDPPPPPPPPPTPAPAVSTAGTDGIQWTGTQQYIAYGVAGLGVIGLVVSGALGGAALGKHGDLEDACGDDPCPERQDDIDSGRALTNASNVSLALGLVAISAGAVIFLTAPSDDTNPEAVTALRLGPGSFAIEGTF